VKIAICDDDLRCRQELTELISAYAAENPDRNVELLSFSTADELLAAAVKVGGYDIYILDIIMPGMNGITLGTRLRQLGSDGKVIYLTSSREFALDSFRSRPFDYLLKPMDKAAFLATLSEAAETVAMKQGKSILVRTQEGTVKIDLNSILCAILTHRVVVYHLTGGRTVKSVQVRGSFAEAVQELLTEDSFVLCGAGMAANLRHIAAVRDDSLLFRGDFSVYLGKKACRDIRSVWYDYNFRPNTD